MSIFNLV